MHTLDAAWLIEFFCFEKRWTNSIYYCFESCFSPQITQWRAVLSKSWTIVISATLMSLNWPHLINTRQQAFYGLAVLVWFGDLFAFENTRLSHDLTEERKNLRWWTHKKGKGNFIRVSFSLFPRSIGVCISCFLLSENYSAKRELTKDSFFLLRRKRKRLFLFLLFSTYKKLESQCIWHRGREKKARSIQSPSTFLDLHTKMH